MIITNTNSIISSNVPQNGTNFTIEASAHAFQILSSGIYQHKIAAIIRELMTNAYDSHKDANKESVPFNVVLPNNLHPYFEVEDFGIGMSVEDAFNVFTVYFKSTKRGTNEVAGGIGIGGKCPFSYTKQFTVRIRKDGEENTCLIYIDQNGEPRLDIVHTVNTDQCNGVKITVPVQPGDFNQFKYEFEFYSSFFPVTPTVNFEDVTQLFDPKEFVNSDKDFIVLERGRYGYAALGSEFIYALMGPVAYPIDLSSVAGVSEYASDVLSSVRRHNRNSVLFIRFNIGDVIVAASRESLSLDTRSCAVIAQKIEEYVNAITKDAQEIIKTDKHIAERIVDICRAVNIPEIASKTLQCCPEYMIFYNKVSGLKNLGSLYVRSGWSKRQRHYTLNKLDWRNGTYYQIAFNKTSGRELPKAVHILALDTDKKRVFELIEQHINATGSTYAWNGVLKEHQRKRLEKILGVPVVVTSYHDLYEKMLADKRKNRASVQRTKYDDKNIQASGLVVNFKEDGSLNINSFSAARVEIKENMYFVDCTDDADTLLYVSQLLKVLESFGTSKEMMIVKKQKRNEKKLLRHDVPDIMDYIEEESLKHKGSLTLANVIHYDHSVRGIKALFFEAESPCTVLYQDAYKTIKKYEELSISIPVENARWVFSLLPDEIVEARKKIADEIGEASDALDDFDVDEYIQKYPLVAYSASSVVWTKFSDMAPTFREHAVNYIKMIDSTVDEPTAV